MGYRGAVLILAAGLLAGCDTKPALPPTDAVHSIASDYTLETVLNHDSSTYKLIKITNTKTKKSRMFLSSYQGGIVEVSGDF